MRVAGLIETFVAGMAIGLVALLMGASLPAAAMGGFAYGALLAWALEQAGELDE